MLFRFATVLPLLLVLSFEASALEVPKLQDRVTDLTGVLSASEKSTLEAQLHELENTDSTQIAVLIIPSLEGDSLEDYSIRVVNEWKLGQAGNNNGALLLIAINDRKIRIEAGYGLESTLTDLISGRIIRNDIAPLFKVKDYYGGINAGVIGIIQTVRGAYHGSPEQETESSRSHSGSRLFHLIIMLLFPLLWILSKIGPKGRRNTRGFGGPVFWGGGGGGFSSGGGGFGGGGGFSGGGGGFGGGGSSGSW